MFKQWKCDLLLLSDHLTTDVQSTKCGTDKNKKFSWSDQIIGSGNAEEPRLHYTIVDSTATAD